jgi:hypothetical protein
MNRKPQLFAFFFIFSIYRYGMAGLHQQGRHFPVRLQDDTPMNRILPYPEHHIDYPYGTGAAFLAIVACGTRPEGFVFFRRQAEGSPAYEPPDIQCGMPAGRTASAAQTALHAFQDVKIRRETCTFLRGHPFTI